MKKALVVTLCARRARRRDRVVAGAATAAPAKTQDASLTGTGATFPFPLISKWIPEVGKAYGINITYSPDRLGRRDRRRSRPAPSTSAPPMRRCPRSSWTPARAASSSRGRSRPRRSRTTCRASAVGSASTAPTLAEHLPGQDHELERRGDQEAQPEAEPAGPEDHAGLPLGRIGDDVQLHRVPLGVSSAVKTKVGNNTSVNFPTGVGARGSSGVAGVV